MTKQALNWNLSTKWKLKTNKLYWILWNWNGYWWNEAVIAIQIIKYCSNIVEILPLDIDELRQW